MKNLNKVSGGRQESGDMSINFGDFSAGDIEIGDYTKRKAEYSTETKIVDK